MAIKLNNDLNIDINVFFQFNGNRRAAFIGNESKLSKKGKKELHFSNIGRGMEYELHIELPSIPFEDGIKGVKIKPGKLGRPKNNFELFQMERGDANNVFIIAIKFERPGNEITGNEPQVLHPEDKPIIPIDG